MSIQEMESRVRLTSFTDYGLRMASLPDRAFSTADLVQGFGLPRDHLSKRRQCLSRECIVETRRGGGAILARPPQDVELAADPAKF